VHGITLPSVQLRAVTSHLMPLSTPAEWDNRVCDEMWV
jgi:hypothetical protein